MDAASSFANLIARNVTFNDNYFKHFEVLSFNLYLHGCEFTYDK